MKFRTPNQQHTLQTHIVNKTKQNPLVLTRKLHQNKGNTLSSKPTTLQLEDSKTNQLQNLEQKLQHYEGSKQEISDSPAPFRICKIFFFFECQQPNHHQTSHNQATYCLTAPSHNTLSFTYNTANCCDPFRHKGPYFTFYFKQNSFNHFVFSQQLNIIY